jgi:hypothetical protein
LFSTAGWPNLADKSSGNNNALSTKDWLRGPGIRDSFRRTKSRPNKGQGPMKQLRMQVQSSADPPKKFDPGERAVMADGNEYNIFRLEEKGRPVERTTPGFFMSDRSGS